MATIWTLASTKGGCGKTTLIAIIASEIVRMGGKVVLIDTDPNTPVLKWAAMGNLPPAVTVIDATDQTTRAFAKALAEHKPTNAFILIDTEGSQNLLSGLAMHAADVVIVPMKWSALDKDEVLKIENFLDASVQVSGRRAASVIVPSQVDTAITTRTSKSIQADLEQLGLTWIDPPVLNKDAYRAMFTQGRLLQDLEHNGQEASIKNARSNAEAVVRTIATAAVEFSQRQKQGKPK